MNSENYNIVLAGWRWEGDQIMKQAQGSKATICYNDGFFLVSYSKYVYKTTTNIRI